MAEAERREEMWCLPELLRLKARYVLRQGGPDPARALRDRATQLAQQFQLRSWELRIAIDEAVLLRRDGKPTEAIALLTGVMAGVPRAGRYAGLAPGFIPARRHTRRGHATAARQPTLN